MTFIHLADVSVRVDDLDARERSRVATTNRLISDITGRDGAHIGVGMMAFLMVVVVFLLGALGFENGRSIIGYAVMTIIVALALGWMAARSSYNFLSARTKTDLFDLNMEVRMSSRARELLDVYLLVHPYFECVFPKELLTKQTA
ncbi:MAG: hypothetical protein Q7S48_02300 [bacterium]|nr:hypothetical protein [bacterium]